MTYYKINCYGDKDAIHPNKFDSIDEAKEFINRTNLRAMVHDIVPVDETEYDLTDDGTGKKYDSGKSMVGTVARAFPHALLGVGKCIEFGTHKYPDPLNWQKVENGFTRYQDSMMRHYIKFLAGQEIDDETNLLHLSHMAWNALAILELYYREHKDDKITKELFK